MLGTRECCLPRILLNFMMTELARTLWMVRASLGMSPSSKTSSYLGGCSAVAISNGRTVKLIAETQVLLNR